MARYAPPNLTHLVFDNESLLSVGGFPTATSTGSDLAAIARGAGIDDAVLVTNEGDFVSVARDAIARDRLSVVVAKVDETGPSSFHMDLHMLENRFEYARWVQSRPPAGSPETGAVPATQS
jgi:sulfopyruvate decarboxylase subunit beta